MSGNPTQKELLFKLMDLSHRLTDTTANLAELNRELIKLWGSVKINDLNGENND